MQDPWKYVAFPVSAILGFFAAQNGAAGFSGMVGLNQFTSKIVLLAATGLIAGFLVDEMLPAYVEKVREGGGEGAGGMGGDGDMDFDSDSGGDDFDFE
ncbi:MAG: hypothetical protein ABEJ75_04295 [Candidatus Nanohaloarchaea archaeon]